MNPLVLLVSVRILRFGDPSKGACALCLSALDRARKLVSTDRCTVKWAISPAALA